MQLRLAELHDYQALLSLLQQLNPEDPSASDFSRRVFQEIVASPMLKLLVAEGGQGLAGSCYLNIIPNLTRAARPYALIENVITADECRRQRVGQLLLDYAVALATKEGCYKIMLMSGRSDPGVHAFYQHCGFNADEKQAYIRTL